jgi:xanthine dehydrogenase accessory factor
VRFQAPISGKTGNKAIIFPDGTMWGWIGGGCAQPVVIKEALQALADGKPPLVRISPKAASQDGILDYTMTCHSGGTLDICIEPVLRKPHLLILGRSPIAQTLARLAKAIHYRVSVAAPGADRERFPDADHLQPDLHLEAVKISADTCVVVSTQGESDEEALQQAAAVGAEYVAFVASKVKARKVLEYLREAGISPERVNQIRSPAGLDIGATSPEEIAVSLLAEIVQLKGARAEANAPPRQNVLAIVNKQAKDPVCGMRVGVAQRSTNQNTMRTPCTSVAPGASSLLTASLRNTRRTILLRTGIRRDDFDALRDADKCCQKLSGSSRRLSASHRRHNRVRDCASI